MLEILTLLEAQHILRLRGRIVTLEEFRKANALQSRSNGTQVQGFHENVKFV
ncbi:hypothetical protein D3C78_1768040 [compost metagenome]